MFIHVFALLSDGSLIFAALVRKYAVENTETLDFLKEIVEGVADPSAGGTIDLAAQSAAAKRGKARKKEEPEDEDEEDADEAPKKKRKPRKKKAKEEGLEVQEEIMSFDHDGIPPKDAWD
jgi:Dr1-associated corepressor